MTDATVRILHVDDDPMQHLLLSEQMRALLPQAAITPFVSVDQAIEHLEGLLHMRAALPEAIICDVNMPVHSGWTLAGLLKSDGRLAHIPVIMATTEVNLDLESAFQTLAKLNGIAAAVKKPIETESLKAALRVVFPSLFPPVNFLVLDNDPNYLGGALLKIRGWLVGMLQYPRPLTTNQAEGALTLLDANLGTDAIIVGLEDPAALTAFLRKVRESEKRRDMPIIVIADPADAEGQRRTIEAGATGFIATPLNLAHFRAGLQQSFGLPPRDWPAPAGQVVYLTGAAQPWD